MEQPQTNYVKAIKKEKHKIEDRQIDLSIKIKDLLLINNKYDIKINNIYHIKLYVENEFDLPVGWYKIQIVYKRSGVLFFTFLNTENSQEYAFFEDSLFMEDLIPEKIRLRELNLKDDYVEKLQIESYNDPFDVKFILNSGKELIYKQGKCR
jgi:hypothetical protein